MSDLRSASALCGPLSEWHSDMWSASAVTQEVLSCSELYKCGAKTIHAHPLGRVVRSKETTLPIKRPGRLCAGTWTHLQSAFRSSAEQAARTVCLYFAVETPC